MAEMPAVEDLQRDVWGVPDLEVVPGSHLIAAVVAGGVLLGAYDGQTLVGFAYGFVSYEKNQTAHHSHMLAVKPEYRQAKLGERLKLAQREFVLGQGIKLMSWTFDPLQSLNAYFNFNKLGVVSDTYIVDFYGAEAASFLHQNSTDRLWISWYLDSRRVIERENRRAENIEFENVRRLVELDEYEAPRFFDLSKTDEPLAIEIPVDINELQNRDIGLAVEWRKATRRAFTTAFERGYIVKEFYRGKRDNQQFGVYLLFREI